MKDFFFLLPKFLAYVSPGLSFWLCFFVYAWKAFSKALFVYFGQHILTHFLSLHLHFGFGLVGEKGFEFWPTVAKSWTSFNGHNAKITSPKQFMSHTFNLPKKKKKIYWGNTWPFELFLVPNNSDFWPLVDCPFLSTIIIDYD